MRHFFFAASLALSGGLAISAYATVSHTSAAHARIEHLQTAGYHRRVSARASRKSAHQGKAAAHAHAMAARETHSTKAKRRAAAEVAAVPVSTARARRASLTTENAEVTETILPIPMRNGRLFVPPPLVGSRASLIRQNERTEADGLERIEDDAALDELRRERSLVLVPVSQQLHINEELPMNRRYCRPWTAKFLADLSRAHYARFHRPLQVNSAVRTVAYQRRLIEVNGNAAPADGDIASPHLTGAAVDIAKKGLSMSEVAWMRAYLLPLQTAGKLDVEEEFYQSCFHIAVYKSYAPPEMKPKFPARRNPTTLLAERVR